MVVGDCILAWKVLCVSRLSGGPRLMLAGKVFLCSQALWWPETVFWLVRFFV